MEIPEMKDRIAHIIRAKNLTAAEFAIQLGIQPSNVSHLLAGRNNPSLDFVKKLKETFPEYNLDWIVFGSGPMTVSDSLFDTKPISELKNPDNQPVVEDAPAVDGSMFAPEIAKNAAFESLKDVESPDLKRIILVYNDNSFEILSPK